MFLALDLETAPNEAYLSYPDAALDHNRADITVCAVASASGGNVYRNLSHLSKYAGRPLTCHNGKFDFKQLLSHGSPITIDQYAHDTMLMAVALSEKVPDWYLVEYEQKRSVLNKALGKAVHRRAGKYSLKVLAPYWLKVPAFWEVDNHNNDAYVIKDAQYTAMLAHRLEEELHNKGGWDFYENHLMPWSKMLLAAEYRGVSLDFNLLSQLEGEYAEKAAAASAALQQIWAPQFKSYIETESQLIKDAYSLKKATAIQKIKAPTPEKVQKTAERYNLMAEKALSKVEGLNLGSPTQLKWLLKESLGLDVTTFDGEDESTGKAVLERLAGQGVPGVPEFLEYRQASKLTTAFFPSYREMSFKGNIHASFNLNGTRTGRLSSSSPNLQQISKRIMPLFKARDGYSLVYRDVSAIEPRLIAYATNCEKLCRIFIEGTDFHSENVRTMMGIQEEDSVIKSQFKKERDLVKEVGLALMYGAGAGRILECAAKRGFSWSEKECRDKYYRFKEEYKDVWAFKKALEDSIKEGNIAENILGRPLNFEMARLHMQSMNSYIQSAGSDVLLESVRMTLDKCRSKEIEAHPLLFIHDSAILEVPDAQAEEVYDLMGYTIAAWDLPTNFGNVILKSEGYIAKCLQ